MRHCHTIRSGTRAFFAFVTLGLVAACGDTSSVAPTAEVQAIVAPANYVKVGGSMTFRVNNAQGAVKKIGAHVINIPAGAICDLTSDYGPAHWNSPCKPHVGSVTITATVFAGPNAQPYIDFQPAMRFAPGTEVTIFLREGRTNAPVSFTVQFCNNLGVCIDESLSDPSLKPFRIGNTSIIGRRVKHFSGYAIIAGDRCDGTITYDEFGNAFCDMGGGMTRKSGYMVASGDDITTTMNTGEDKKKEDEK